MTTAFDLMLGTTEEAAKMGGEALPRRQRLRCCMRVTTIPTYNLLTGDSFSASSSQTAAGSQAWKPFMSRLCGYLRGGCSESGYNLWMRSRMPLSLLAPRALARYEGRLFPCRT